MVFEVLAVVLVVLVVARYVSIGFAIFCSPVRRAKPGEYEHTWLKGTPSCPGLMDGMLNPWPGCGWPAPLPRLGRLGKG